MKKRISLIAAAALLVMQACSFEEIKIEPDGQQVDPYKVQIYADITQQPATKVAVDDGFCAGDVVGVYLVNYEGENPGTLKLEDNQADNVKFSFDENGNWISEYDIYYKDNETNVDFYAYYPYAEPTSIETYPFEVARDQSKGPGLGQLGAYEASDFLWAKKENVTPTASKVILTFRHRMASARIRFSQGTGWDDAAEYAAVTKDVLVTNTIRKSKINLSTGVVTPVGEAPLTGIVPMNDNGDYRAIVVPQIVEAGKTVLTLTIGGHPRHYVRDMDTEYLPGKMTTFDMTISKNANTGEFEVELTGVSITAWEADNVSHGDDAREYVVVHNEYAGQLERTIVDRLEMDAAKIKNLKITGKITTEDYAFIRKNMTSLMRLNLWEVESSIDGVYAIPANAFSGSVKLQKCLLPERLERIESGAFAGTDLAGSMSLPEGLKYVSGFSGTNITRINFPNSLKEIGANAFSDCQSFMCEVCFPAGLEIIGNYAFERAGITGNLVLPESLTKIGSSAFRSCYNLSGSLVIPSKIKEIPNYAFSSTGFSNLILPDGLESIGEVAFGSSHIRGELRIPKGVKTIGSSAFQGTLISSVSSFPEDITITGGIFNDCKRLTGVIALPEHWVSVPAGMFQGCEVLEGVILPKNIEVIEQNAFNRCYLLNTIECKAKQPPVVQYQGLGGVPRDNFVIKVPETSVKMYKVADTWGEFKRIEAQRNFSISRDLFRALNAKCTRTFIVRADAGKEWHVENKPDWVEVSPMSGVGKEDVTITINAMARGAGNRMGEIDFVLDGTTSHSVMDVEQYDYMYGDGDIIEFQRATKGNGEINIVMLADCFDAKDISEGAVVDAMTDVYEAYFELPPYDSYKDYFNVIGVIGMSADSGPGVDNESRYHTGIKYWDTDGGSNIGGDIPEREGLSLWDAVMPEVDRVTNGLPYQNTQLVIIHNTDDYDSEHMPFRYKTTDFYETDEYIDIAYITFMEDEYPYDFRGDVQYYACGCGFGRLASEHVSRPGAPNIYEKDGFTIRFLAGYYQNASLSKNRYTVPWSHLIYDPQYSDVVDVYTGAYEFSLSVYRSEPASIMSNRKPYFNAISRELIVKRIMKLAGEEYSFEDFKAYDRENLY